MKTKLLKKLHSKGVQLKISVKSRTREMQSEKISSSMSMPSLSNHKASLEYLTGSRA